jgi:predicted metal-dependent hydrolase
MNEPNAEQAGGDGQAYDARYLAGIEYFNDCEFFEAHEVWEELWADDTGPSRRFHQGLIQVAVCLHHFGNGNIRGARKLYHSSRGYLEAYRPVYRGIDIDQLLRELQVCCQEILESSDEYPQIEIVPDRIPEIHLQ